MRALVILSVLLITTSTASSQMNDTAPYGSYGNNPYIQQGFNQGQRWAWPQQRVQQRVPGPAEMMRQGINELRTFLVNGKNVSSGDLSQFVKARMSNYFDFNYMTRLSVGPSWRRMNAAERDQAKGWLAQNVLARLTEYVADIRALRIDVLTGRPGMSRGELVVPIRMWRRNMPPVSLNFRFYGTQGGWRIFDVSANGQSAIIFYRGYINRMMRGRG